LCKVIGKRIFTIHFVYIRTEVLQCKLSTFCTFSLQRVLIFLSCTNFVCNMISQWQIGHGKYAENGWIFSMAFSLTVHMQSLMAMNVNVFEQTTDGRYVIDVWEYRCCMYTCNVHTHTRTSFNMMFGFSPKWLVMKVNMCFYKVGSLFCNLLSCASETCLVVEVQLA
jgi:hypothetical protein